MKRRQVSGLAVAITGGARGIGRSTAEAFRRAGARVVIGDIDAGLAKVTADELTGAGGGYPVIGLPLDVTAEDFFTDFLDAAELAIGPLDVLVNNAGIMPTGLFRDEDPAVTDRMLSLNLAAVITGSRLALQRFSVRSTGHLINIASLAGAFAVPALATYSATKAAVINFTDSLELELTGTGMRATAVLPGLVNTELSAGANYPAWIGGAVAVEPEDVAAAIVNVVARGKVGTVSVPAVGLGVIKVLGLLPRRLRIAAERRAGLDTAFAHADPAIRARYHHRIGIGDD